MERARVVVVGGGITGTSVAYHLAKAGWTDTVLVEKGELTSGSTCHAAGLVTQFNPSPTMMRFRRYSVELYRELDVFETVGSLRIASSPESLKELQRGASRARAIGLDVEIVPPEEAVNLMPAASADSLHGAVWIPSDGAVDPHTATYALANAARELGVRICTGRRLTGVELGLDREVRSVETDQGPIETECVVNACGIWAPQVTAMVGAFTPSVPVDHQHIALAAVPGHELARELPCFRDTDNLVYGKAEGGGMLFGGYEANPVARWEDGVPWEHGGVSLPPDQDRFRPLMEGAIRRFPFLADAGMVALVCHPDSMTPDGNPLLGPVPGVRGFWLAAGLSLNGFGGAGGMGKTAAELITAGESELDVQGYRPWRFGAPYRDPDFTTAAAREVYKYYYRLRYPLDTDEWGRPQRLSPLHGRLQELGAVFGMKNGWERADYFRPGQTWRRAGADQREFGWTAPPYLELLAEEHRAFRERVGIIDMTSFGKLEVSGPAALALLERAADNRIDRPAGSVVYTQFLDERGGIVADVTVTRLAEDCFRVITGAGAVDSDRGWLELARREGEELEIRDVTDELAVVGVWGPHARAVLRAVTEDDVSGEALPFRRAKEIRVGGAPVLAQRITYVGELGFELYVERDWAVQVWDRLVAAGGQYGMSPGGYRVLESLRLEKGYRYFGTDLTAGDTPLEAGLDFCVAWDKDFTGRAALEGREPERRLRTLLVGNESYETVYGGEAIHADGAVVGRVRSAGYGFTIRRNVALGYVPAGLEEGAELGIEVFGELIPAEVARDTLYDPENERVRA
jgi:glycine cleavage system aminomethyltransferase T/glycine/D-amino acid oxidase-like deaminating enzyme